MNPNAQKAYETWQPFLLSLAVVIGMIIGVKFSDKKLGDMIENVSNSTDIGNGRVEDIIRFIENKYVDSIRSDSLVELAIQSVISSLDPHSIYIKPNQLEFINEQMKGSFDGLGLETLVVGNELAIVSVVDDGPADKGGVKVRDRIISVNKDTLFSDSLSFDYVSRHLSGLRGDTIKLFVKRLNELKKLEIIIDKVEIPSVEASYEITPGVAYIKLKRFSATTYQEFMKALEPLLEQGHIKDLIIDLKDNPGGYLPETTKILGQLFPQKNKLMVYTKGKNAKLTEYKTNGQTFYDLQEVIILINENSASGSEIIAGAVQDWDRGLVIGRRSYGKGLVQEQFLLSNGGAIRLTVSRYYTPIGRSIQRSYLDMEHYRDDFNERVQNGELFNGETHAPEDSQVYLTKILKREMYGSGGIIPDIIVPVDSLEYLYAYHEIETQMASFIFQYLESNPQDFEYTQEAFIDNYVSDQKMLDEFWKFSDNLKKKNLLTSNPGFKSFLKEELKGVIAKQLFSEEAKVISENKKDPDILKALEALQLKDMLSEYSKIK